MEIYVVADLMWNSNRGYAERQDNVDWDIFNELVGYNYYTRTNVF